MHKIILFTLSGCLWWVNSLSQPASIEGILQEIDKNNPELKALAEYVKSKTLALKSENNLPDLQLGAYYLPFGEHSGGDYTEFEISQSMEFPTVYLARKNLIHKKAARLELEYQSKRQETLLLASRYCLNIIYLNKKLETERLRMLQAKKLYEQVQELHRKEQIGVLELNKAKIAWLQEQFQVQKIQGEKKSLMLLLSGLNGGDKLIFEPNDYYSSLDLAEMDSLWRVKQEKDPEILQLKQEENISLQSLKLAKNNYLPDLSAGYNYQGVSGSNYSGLYAGLSIPLWNNRNKVRAARSQLDFQQLHTASMMTQALGYFEKQYHEYSIMLERFREYQISLADLNSEQLLLQAYQLGEISFREYYMELQFYRLAYDGMLQMQYELHLLQVELLKHHL